MFKRDRFDKFTERARKVLSLAQEEAYRLQQNAIGTEHLLLGLLGEGEGVAAKVLVTLGADLQQMRSIIEADATSEAQASEQETRPGIGLTPEAKKAIERAVDEARRLNHHYIGTEHLLLGLARIPESKAAQILESQGIRLEKMRTQTIQIVSTSGGSSRQTSTTSASTTQTGQQGERDRFDRFDTHARRVLNFAQEEAQRFQHNYIGTEHLLLGLSREREGIAAQVLTNLGISLDEIRSGVEFIIGRGDRIVLGEIGLTPRAKKVIELAADESRRMNHDYVGSEHLLLGLVREGEGIAAGVLQNLGVSLAQIRAETLHVLGGTDVMHTEEAAPSSSSVTQERLSRLEARRLGALSKELSREYNFTEQAQRVLQFAQAEAERLQHTDVAPERVLTYIAPEHILLGLLHEEKDIAARVLTELGVDLVRARNSLVALPNHGERVLEDKLHLLPLIKAHIHLAAYEASRSKQHSVNTGHLLLSLVRIADDHVVQILSSAGVSLESVRTRTLQALQEQ